MRTILHLEDDENDILLLRYAFKSAGVSTILRTVHDGNEAIDYLSGTEVFGDRKLYPFPDLVLLDLKTPGKDGFEVLHWIRQQAEFDSLVVILFSASANLSDKQTAYRLRANSFVVKPLGVDKLVEFVRALHEYWFIFNEFVVGSERVALTY